MFEDEDHPADEAPADLGQSTEKRRRLSAHEWVQIVDIYEMGNKGISELADEYGVTRQTISRYFQQNNIQRGSKAAQIAAQAAVAASAAAAKAAERYAEKRAEWIEETRIQGYNNLKQAAALINKRIVEIYKTPGGAPAAALDDIKTLKLYQQALIENFNFRLEGILKASDMMDETNLPTLEISDLTDEDLDEHYRAIGMSDAADELNEIVSSDEDLDVKT